MSFLSTLKANAQKVLAVIENDGAEVVQVVHVIGDGVTALENILTNGKQLEPALQSQFGQLVKAGEALATAAVAAGIGKGTNFSADAATIAALEEFYPVMVDTLKLLKTDVAAVTASVTGPASLADMPKPAAAVVAQ